MFVVGVTGGIGSGKTAVTHIFAKLGIHVVDADVVAREIVQPGQPALEAIVNHFGPAVLDNNGHLDRSSLRELIFRDPAERRWLEELLHPLIGQEVQRQLQAGGSPYVIYASPLLIEKGQQTLCNRVLVVDLPEELQLERTGRRDQQSREQVQRIMATQASRTERLRHADDILENSGSLERLEQQVRKLHEHYLELANQSQTEKRLTVNCPGCGAKVTWGPASPFRPFCSERCRNEDFIGWAEGERVIPGDPTFDDLLSGDLLPRD
ncbi:MAG: dephospho-CoA kinase [Spongiibacteraceae bacterium]|jgi:dephospho-CoA kinase|nr:dephospho-CoA kinase [Spongiibacteraceae bacterium]